MTQRNMVVLLCDQLRPDFLSLYGCRAAPTPNLERLAATGVVFDRAVTQSAVCAPARACMMTGRYVCDHDVWTNDVPFRDGLDYLAERMNALGRRTGAFGKLHHTPVDDPKGFSVTAQMEEGRLGEDEPYLRWLRKRRPDVRGVWNSTNHVFDFPEEEYHEHWIASAAVDFINDSADGDAPFLAWVSFQGPHAPFDPPAEVKGTVDESALPGPVAPDEGVDCPVHLYRRHVYPGPRDETARRQRIAYAEMIVEIDRQIGRILDTLERKGVLENTTVVFSADHGDLLGDFGHMTKGPFPWKGQLDIPLVVANHPDIPAGERRDHLVGNIDIPATCLHVAGEGPLWNDSRSLLDQAREKPEYPRECIFSEEADTIKIVDTPTHRYAWYPFLDTAHLFDREADPEERENLAGRPETAEIELACMRRLAEFRMLGSGLRMPAYDFVPEQQAGVRALRPAFEDMEFPVAFPMSAGMRKRLAAAGLDTDYNEFCRRLPLTASYGVYWEQEANPSSPG